MAVIAEAPSHAQPATEALTSYFHQMLHGLLGWSQTARYRLWQAELAGETDPATLDMLAIRLAFEIALFAQYESRSAHSGRRWRSSMRSRSRPAKA